MNVYLLLVSDMEIPVIHGVFSSANKAIKAARKQNLPSMFHNKWEEETLIDNGFVNGLRWRSASLTGLSAYEMYIEKMEVK